MFQWNKLCGANLNILNLVSKVLIWRWVSRPCTTEQTFSQYMYKVFAPYLEKTQLLHNPHWFYQAKWVTLQLRSLVIVHIYIPCPSQTTLQGSICLEANLWGWPLWIEAISNTRLCGTTSEELGWAPLSSHLHPKYTGSFYMHHTGIMVKCLFSRTQSQPKPILCHTWAWVQCPELLSHDTPLIILSKWMRIQRGVPTPPSSPLFWPKKIMTKLTLKKVTFCSIIICISVCAEWFERETG